MASDIEIRKLNRALSDVGRSLKEISKALNQLVCPLKEDRRLKTEEDGDAS